MGNLVVIEHDTWEQAVNAAGAEAATTMASSAPVVLYEQARRQFMVTSFPLTFVADRVKIDTLKKGDDPDAHYNRPLIPEHVRSISKYLQNPDSYILPPLTLCVEDSLTVHVPRSSSTVKTGIVVLPHSLMFIVTDGQHRIKGIQEALKVGHHLIKDGIAVTIVNEQDIEKVHQDFVDCAQTKAISRALLTAFNVRDSLAKLVRQIATDVIVFRNRIEKVGTTVGKNSVNIFTMNQLRAGVAELLVGNSVLGQSQLRERADERLADDQLFSMHFKRISEFYRKFAAKNEQWTNLVLSAEHPGMDKIDTNDMREKFLHFTATGLVIIGRVGHYILQQDESDQDDFIDRLANISWERDSELWSNNVVSFDGKVVTQNSPVNTAVLLVKKTVGLPLTESEKRRELDQQPQLVEA